MSVQKIIISGISHFLPEKIISNHDLIKDYSLKMKAEWVEKRIGIIERRWAGKDVAASDLAVAACQKLDLNKFSGAIWLSTISGDYPTPSTSSLVKRKLNLKDQCPTIDINAACAGHIFALEMAVQRLKCSEETEALVIASEVRSKWLNKNDRRTVFLFGDGACAIKLSKVNSEGEGIRWSESITIASEIDDILVPAGGSQLPITHKELDEQLNFIKMNDGTGIFEKTTQNLLDVIKNSLSKKNEKIEDYDFLVFHQGNGAIIRTICEKLNLSLDKTHINFDKFGNTSSASMGIALSEAYELGKIKKGDRVLLLAMGAGYHISCISLQWEIA